MADRSGAEIDEALRRGERRNWLTVAALLTATVFALAVIMVVAFDVLP